MRAITILALGLALSAGSCGGGGDLSTGSLGILLKDGPIQVVNETRTITKLEIDIVQIRLESEGLEEGDSEQEGEDSNEPVVFDTSLGDNGGVPMTVDLLTLTSSSMLLATVNVPVGVYHEAKLRVTAARAEFQDNPGVLVPLVLAGEEAGQPDTFDFDFLPQVTVSATGVTFAQIDFIPVVTKVGADYVLTHDDLHDESGEVE